MTRRCLALYEADMRLENIRAMLIRLYLKITERGIRA